MIINCTVSLRELVSSAATTRNTLLVSLVMLFNRIHFGLSADI